MKKILFIFLVITSSINVFASSGGGIQYKINNFTIFINWFDEEKYSYYDFLNLTLLVNDNYDKLKLLDGSAQILIHGKSTKIVFNSTKGIILNDNTHENIDADKIKQINYINSELATVLKLNKDYNRSCELFVAFIPIEILDNQNNENNNIQTFLNSSEFFINHPAALQNNLQGYIYSIYFNKQILLQNLEMLKSEKVVIINKKSLYQNNEYKWFYKLDLVIF